MAHRASCWMGAVCLAAVACTQPRVRAVAPVQSTTMTPDERVAHVLSRLSFGARPGDVERVKAMGVERWIDEQLEPTRVNDDALTEALASFPTWTKPMDDLSGLGMRIVRDPNAPPPVSTKTVTADGVMYTMRSPALAIVYQPNDLFAIGKIIRAQRSERQLFEVIADFWENHFSVFSQKLPSRDALITWSRAAIRPNALGKFRDLLGAVVHNPALPFYLDNQASTKNGLNENFARELMELHTLGVDGGYTQRDVTEVARAFTGWGIDTASPAAGPRKGAFYPIAHDSGAKTVLGHALRAGRGEQDGEDVLDILARHPSTARFISLKLARRLVSDTPSASLVDRAAATFTRTGGDIREVVRMIVTSDEFFARDAFRAKVKTPFELVVSMKRALGAHADTTTQTTELLRAMQQPVFGRQSPDGWPDAGAAWMNAGSLMQRLLLAEEVAEGKKAFISANLWPGWNATGASATQQVEAITHGVLGGVASAATKEAMLSARAERDAATDRDRLTRMLAVALASPEFQRR